MLSKLASPYVVGVASRAWGQAVAFLGVMVASRFLDLEAFGTFALVWAVTVIGNSFVFTGFYQAVLRSRDIEQDGDTLFWTNIALGAAFGAAMLVLGALTGGGSTALGLAFWAVAAIPVLTVPIAWYESLLVRDKRVRAASLYVAVSELLGLAVTWAALEAGYGMPSLILGRYAATFAALAVTGALVGRLPRLRVRRDTAVEGTRSAVPLWGTSAVGLFSNYGADLILGAFLSPAAVGAWRGGARIAMTASDLVLQPLLMMSWSRFTTLEKEGGDLRALREAWIETMALGAACLWPLTICIALTAPELVTVVLDETWLPAAPIVAILAVSRALRFLSAMLEPVMVVTDRPGVQLRIRLVSAGVLLALLLGLGPFGGVAAALGHMAGGAQVAVASLVATAAALEMPGRQMARAFLPGLALTAACAALTLGLGLATADMGTGAGLAVTAAVVASVWTAVMVVLLKRRVLRLPTP